MKKNKKNKIILSFIMASLLANINTFYYNPKITFASSVSSDITLSNTNNISNIVGLTSSNSNYSISLQVNNNIAYINGEAVEMYNPPYLSNGNTMIPINLIISALDIPLSDVEYKTSPQEVRIKYNNNYISFYINSGIIRIYSSQTTTINMINNGKTEMVNNNVFMPITELCEVFNMKFSWDSSTQTVTLSGTKLVEEVYTEDTTIREFEEEVITLVNIERTKRGLEPLQIYEPAMILARKKSQEMASTNYFAHTDLNGVYMSGQLNANQSIAANYLTPQELVNGWMSSFIDRFYILNPYNSYIGVGLAEGDKNSTYDLYWTQVYLSNISRYTN